MTFREIESALRQAGIAEAAEEAGLLLCRFAGIPRAELVFRREEDFSSPELAAALERRKKREPLQYILGSWEFYGLPFFLNSDCLCPRPDTETVVDWAIRCIPQNGVFCDIGTGSGAIAVAVLRHREDLRAMCADISEGALRAAAQNAAVNGVADRCRFVCCDALRKTSLEALGSFDTVVSNPPYIRSADIASLAPELSYEPRRALDGGEDGLSFYRAILAADIYRPGGFAIFEIGFDQGDDLRSLAVSCGRSCEIYRDLGGTDRVAIIK